MSEVRWKTPSGSFAHPFEVWSFCWDCYTNIPGTRPWWPLFQTELGPSFKGFKPQNRGHSQVPGIHIRNLSRRFWFMFRGFWPFQSPENNTTSTKWLWFVRHGRCWFQALALVTDFPPLKPTNGHGVPKETRGQTGWLCFGFCTLVEMAKQKPITSMYDIFT